MSPFASRDLAVLDAAAEIEIETRAGPDAPIHRTIIWVVVEDDTVYVRSVRGQRGRWFRELTAYPESILRVGREVMAVSSMPATEASDIDRCSRALRRKYAGDSALGTMLRPETLPTTLRLEPR